MGLNLISLNKESKLLNENDRVFFENDINNFLTIKNINYNSKNNLIRFFEYMIYFPSYHWPIILNKINIFENFIHMI